MPIASRILLLLITLLATAVGAREAPRVVLISIDALNPAIFADSRWKAPTLQRLAREGAWAHHMRSVFPSVTYVNHASLVTGARPARHGIVANTQFNLQTGPQPGWCFDSRLIQAPALWDLTRQAGLVSAAFSWPVSLGAPVDWNIPEAFHLEGVDQDTTEGIIRRSSTPGLFDELDANLPRPFPQSFAEWDQWLPETFGWIWGRHTPSLALIHLLNLDWTQHRFGPDAPETRQAVEQMDAVVGRLVAKIDPTTTTVLVMGDHGFQPVTRWVALNRLFLDQGWIDLDGGRIRSFQVLAHTNGGSGAIYCLNPQLEPAVLRLLRERAGAAYTVVNRAELDRWQTYPRALCAVSAQPGYGLRADCTKPFLEATPRTLGQHGHLPHLVPTGFIAWGRGVEPGRRLGDISITRVAPTVAHLLGLPHDDMEEPLKLAEVKKEI